MGPPVKVKSCSPCRSPKNGASAVWALIFNLYFKNIPICETKDHHVGWKRSASDAAGPFSSICGIRALQQENATKCIFNLVQIQQEMTVAFLQEFYQVGF